MAVTPKKMCKNCEERKPAESVHLARRFGGGSYRQAGRLIDTLICKECVFEIAPIALNGTGHSLHSQWDLSGIMHLARRLGYQGPYILNMNKREVREWVKETAPPKRHRALLG